MGRKQKERQKKKNNQKLLAAATATATSTASSGDADVDGNNSATVGRSKSVIDVDVDVDVDVGVDVGVAAKKVTMTETTTMATCYHGSTAENVAKGSHFQMVIDEHLSVIKNLVGKNPTEIRIGISNFYAKHKELMNNPEFDQCVFAIGTDMFKKNYGSEEYLSSSQVMLQTVLNLGIVSKYVYSPLSADREKNEKYCRDIMTDRGIINFLFRETNTFCNCMTPYKEEAKRMEKLGMCDKCRQLFPKNNLKRCSRCLIVQYCSNKCMKKGWPTHKYICSPHNKSEE